MKPDDPAEFDGYSSGYDAGLDDPVKRALGADAAAFLAPKLDLLLADTRRRFAATREPLRHLDFGCGTADFLHLASTRGTGWHSEGCDVSPGMITEAGRRWPQLGAAVPLWLVGPEEFPVARYDVITAICVFHHIPPADWLENFARLRRALRPGGRFYLIEHNPWNPVTRLIVARARIDANAVLLSPRRSRALMQAAGFRDLTARHFLFLPPRWSALRGLEAGLGWLPLGGQYILSGSA